MRFILFAFAIFVCVAQAAQVVLQDLDYTDHRETFYNPDRGFYTPQVVHFRPGAMDAKPYGNRFLHLRADISEFSDNSRWGSDVNNPEHGTSQNLTQEMLDSFRKYLDLIRAQNGTVVVRFSYDPWYCGNWNGKFEMEPGQEWILKHVQQLAEVYNEYEDVITAVELGMYGPYGENHTSQLAGPKNSGEALRELILHTNETDLTARTPAVVAQAFSFENYGVTFDVNNQTLNAKADSAGKDFYRVGLFNDGYLGTQYDYGTWGVNCASSICRENGVAWLEKYGVNVPYGGEALTTAGGYKKINTAEFLAYEGFRTHTSYLNIQWNNNLIAEWKKSSFKARDSIDAEYSSDKDTLNTAFKYIDNHLGYRYVLRESKMMDSLGKGSLLQLDLKIQNVGFGNMTKKRKVTLILQPIESNALADSAVPFVISQTLSPLELPLNSEFDPQEILSRKVELVSAFDDNGNIVDYDNIETKTTYDGMNNVKLETTLPEELPEGKYAVFLRISQYGNWPADSNYSTVRFANDVNYYDAKSGSNYVGKFVLSKNAPTVTSISKKVISQNQTLQGVNIHVEGDLLKIKNANRIEIFSAIGNQIFSKMIPNGSADISLQKFSRGILLARAVENGNAIVKKIKW